MQLTITNDSIKSTKKDFDLSEFMRIKDIQVDMGIIESINGQFASMPTAVITASLLNTDIKADGTLLLDFNELSDENLAYIFDEIYMVMQDRGLVK